MKKPVDASKDAPGGKLFAVNTSARLGSGSVALTLNSTEDPRLVDIGPGTVSFG